ncbi:MAG: lipid A biosynthesis acyltransferase [Desulfovibrionales bacterium]|nr:lipid A biosynthesis acyltransferase [Desulfovibrionales bacterium]
MDISTEWWLLAIGFLGQGFFFLRFFWQWIVSEREKRSVIPLCFWYFSLFGSFFLLIYALLRRDIVFTIGQSTGSIIYVRNLYLIHRERAKLAASS